MTRTVTLRIEGMHCASCCLLVDDFMEDVHGVTASSTNLRRGTCEVHADESVAEAELLAAVQAAGYSGAILGG